MTHKVILTPGARQDLVQIYEYIAEKVDPLRAIGYVERIEFFCQSLTQFPERGMRRDDLRLGLRTTGFERRITIAFHIANKEVRIDRILYGGRNLEGMFEDDDS